MEILRYTWWSIRLENGDYVGQGPINQETYNYVQ